MLLPQFQTALLHCTLTSPASSESEPRSDLRCERLETVRQDRRSDEREVRREGVQEERDIDFYSVRNICSAANLI